MIMRDSVTAADIPTDTPVVAGYGDGLYAWSAADWARFPDAAHISIVVNPAHQGDVLDVENGDATPADVPGWVQRFDRPGRRAPTVYCSRAAWPAVRDAVGGWRVDYWISTLDGTQSVPGAVAVQYKDFGGYDESIIQDPTWVEDNTLTNDVARGLVYDIRAALLGDGPGSPNEAAAIEAYVASVVSNVEGGLSALITDCQKDPRYIPGRVAHLEAQMAALKAALG